VRLDIVEGSAPSETKEEAIKSSSSAMDIGALTILGSFARTDRRKMVVINLDRLHPMRKSCKEVGVCMYERRSQASKCRDKLDRGC
jgi:hypothetical protein